MFVYMVVVFIFNDVFSVVIVVVQLCLEMWFKFCLDGIFEKIVGVFWVFFRDNCLMIDFQFVKVVVWMEFLVVYEKFVVIGVFLFLDEIILIIEENMVVDVGVLVLFIKLMNIESFKVVIVGIKLFGLVDKNVGQKLINMNIILVYIGNFVVMDEILNQFFFVVDWFISVVSGVLMKMRKFLLILSREVKSFIVRQNLLIVVYVVWDFFFIMWSQLWMMRSCRWVMDLLVIFGDQNEYVDFELLD